MQQKTVYKHSSHEYSRFMSIITKQGDKGKTRLYSGEEVKKNCERVDTYGTLDELVSFMGLARSLCRLNEVADDIRLKQRTLFRLGTELATEDKTKVKVDPINNSNVKSIEKMIHDYESKITLPEEFAIPGKNRATASIDVARAVCRRFERKLNKFAESGEWNNPYALIYINKLADLLFLMARMEEG